MRTELHAAVVTIIFKLWALYLPKEYASVWMDFKVKYVGIIFLAFRSAFQRHRQCVLCACLLILHVYVTFYHQYTTFLILGHDIDNLSKSL